MDYGESTQYSNNDGYEAAAKRYTSTRETASMVIQEEDEDSDRAAATASRRDVKRASTNNYLQNGISAKELNVDAASDLASSKSSVRHRRGGGSTKTGPLGGEDNSSHADRRTMQPRSEGLDSGAMFKKITTGKLGFRASNALASI
jgi:hypothetical protein